MRRILNFEHTCTCGTVFIGSQWRSKCDACLKLSHSVRKDTSNHTPYRTCPFCGKDIPWKYHESVKRYEAKKTCGGKSCWLKGRPKHEYTKPRSYKTYLSNRDVEVIVRQVEELEPPNSIVGCDTFTVREVDL